MSRHQCVNRSPFFIIAILYFCQFNTFRNCAHYESTVHAKTILSMDVRMAFFTGILVVYRCMLPSLTALVYLGSNKPSYLQVCINVGFIRILSLYGPLPIYERLFVSTSTQYISLLEARVYSSGIFYVRFAFLHFWKKKICYFSDLHCLPTETVSPFRRTFLTTYILLPLGLLRRLSVAFEKRWKFPWAMWAHNVLHNNHNLGQMRSPPIFFQ